MEVNEPGNSALHPEARCKTPQTVELHLQQLPFSSFTFHVFKLPGKLQFENTEWKIPEIKKS